MRIYSFGHHFHHRSDRIIAICSALQPLPSGGTIVSLRMVHDLPDHTIMISPCKRSILHARPLYIIYIIAQCPAKILYDIYSDGERTTSRSDGHHDDDDDDPSFLRKYRKKGRIRHYIRKNTCPVQRTETTTHSRSWFTFISKHYLCQQVNE